MCWISEWKTWLVLEEVQQDFEKGCTLTWGQLVVKVDSWSRFFEIICTRKWQPGWMGKPKGCFLCGWLTWCVRRLLPWKVCVMKRMWVWNMWGNAFPVLMTGWMVVRLNWGVYKKYKNGFIYTVSFNSASGCKALETFTTEIQIWPQKGEIFLNHLF